ncbi:hypothetical protein Tco_0300555 [Tanacetum coccineum]
MDNPNITMEEYIRLEEENTRTRGKVFNWETAKYGKIWYDEDVHDIRSVETKFPAIVFNDNLTSNETLSCEPTIFSTNDLKTDWENDNKKVNKPLFSPSEPEVSYFNDLDFFKDFENEYQAIVYNDALTSKSDFLTEPAVSPQNIDEFNLKDETSLSECDEKEQNVLYFNDLFPFNVIYPDDLKSDTDNDNNKIDIEQPSGDMSVIPLPTVINFDTQGSNKLLETKAFTHNNNNNNIVFETRVSKHTKSHIQLVSSDTTHLLHHHAAAMVVAADNTAGSTGHTRAEHNQVGCKHPVTEHYKLLPCAQRHPGTYPSDKPVCTPSSLSAPT